MDDVAETWKRCELAVRQLPVQLCGLAAHRAFQERIIEAEERREEAVVSKEARVVEEVVVRKEANQRTETISDTIRKTEVDVEDERSVRGTGTMGSTDRKI